MNNIITIQKSETVTSIEAANMIGKEHKQLLKDIRRYINQLEKMNLEYPNKGKISPLTSLLSLHIWMQKEKKDLVLM